MNDVLARRLSHAHSTCGIASKLVCVFACSCQTYEGGFGGEPGTEAHGGYAFCAVAALSILDSLHLADVSALKVCVLTPACSLFCMLLLLKTVLAS